MAAPQQPPAGSQANQFATWVRNYIHYDNLASNYSKQATGARKLKDKFEAEIINNLRQNKMENAVIQITGATLQCTEEKCPPSLTIPRLETYLSKYYFGKGNGMDETDAILRFIKNQKHMDTTTIARLKKTPLPTVVPPPPTGGLIGDNGSGGRQ